MSARPHARLTEEEYLTIERAAEFRSEYYDGQMFAMSGGSWPHALIIGNLLASLHAPLRRKGCHVVSNNARFRVSPSRFYTYPDIVVTCGTPVFADDQKDTLLNPVLLIEVLSSSTEKHDRGFKLNHYREIDSLQEYVLVSQSEPRIESFRRRGSEWIYSDVTGLDAECTFQSIEVSVALAEIYDRVEFDAERPATD